MNRVMEHLWAPSVKPHMRQYHAGSGCFASGKDWFVWTVGLKIFAHMHRYWPADILIFDQTNINMKIYKTIK